MHKETDDALEKVLNFDWDITFEPFDDRLILNNLAKEWDIIVIL